MIKGFKGFADRCWNAHVNRQQRRADYWILTNMSERHLRDINISRAEIRQKIYGPNVNW
mgnify:FL=1